MTSSKTDTAQLNNEDMQWLFTNLVNMYGHLFTASYGSKEAMTLWKNGLNKVGLGRTEIKRALAYCLEYYTSPPSLPQFVEVAKVYKRREMNKLESNNTQPNFETGRKHLAGMLASLKR